MMILSRTSRVARTTYVSLQLLQFTCSRLGGVLTICTLAATTKDSCDVTITGLHGAVMKHRAVRILIVCGLRTSRPPGARAFRLRSTAKDD